MPVVPPLAVIVPEPLKVPVLIHIEPPEPPPALSDNGPLLSVPFAVIDPLFTNVPETVNFIAPPPEPPYALPPLSPAEPPPEPKSTGCAIRL